MKWKEAWLLRKHDLDDWRLTADLMTLKKSKKFFSYETSHNSRSLKPRLNVKYDSIYHQLQVHQMEDIAAALALNPILKTKSKAKTDSKNSAS